jgi:hypothetical protein
VTLLGEDRFGTRLVWEINRGRSRTALADGKGSHLRSPKSRGSAEACASPSPNQ